jgi:uncharacterized protein YlzI (FlbEa/FlbD family)
MTHRRLLQGLISGLAVLLLVSGSAFAKGSRTINVSYAASLGGVRLEAGQYEFNFEQHTPEATVTLAKGKTVVVTTKGKVEERKTKFERNTVVFETKSDGSQTIGEIRLGGTNQAIVFSE